MFTETSCLIEDDATFERVGNEFRSHDGRVLSEDLVANLVASLTGLNRSGEYKLCHKQGLHEAVQRIRLVLVTEDERSADLLSLSGCNGHLPWNLHWNDTLYVQYRPETYAAVYALFKAAGASHIMSPPTQFGDRRHNSLLTPGNLDQGASYSERDFYRALVLSDPRMSEFLDDYEMDGLRLWCDTERENTRCRNVHGVMRLTSHHLDIRHWVRISIKSRQIAEISPALTALRETDQILRTHPTFDRLKSTVARIRFELRPPSLVDNYYPQRIMASAGYPETTTFTSIEVIGGGIVYRLLKFSDERMLWIESLSAKTKDTSEFIRRLNLGSVVDIFESAADADARPVPVVELSLWGCSFIRATIRRDYLFNNPSYLGRLESLARGHAMPRTPDRSSWNVSGSYIAFPVWCTAIDPAGRIITSPPLLASRQ